MQYTVKRANETLDEVVYETYGSSFGYLELVLNNNNFLYEAPIFLKEGTVLELPEIKKEAQSRVSLWN